jgi:hypothetical protein
MLFSLGVAFAFWGPSRPLLIDLAESESRYFLGHFMSENKNNSAKNDGAKDKVDLFPIFRTMYDLVLDFEHAHGQFPKLHKFTVGKRISTSLIVALENIIAAEGPPMIREVGSLSRSGLA